MSQYITHRCKESVENEVSIRKQLTGKYYEDDIIGKWFMGKCELDNEWGTKYLHRFYAPVRYCPFCGKELEI